MPSAVDISGQRFGRLVALKYVGHLRRGSQQKRAFLFQCDCGSQVTRLLMDVRRLDTLSCGCLKRDKTWQRVSGNRLPSGESSFRALFHIYQKRSIVRNISFELTRDDFRALTQRECFYCGEQPSQMKWSHQCSHGPYVYNGIDRLDSRFGYTLANTVSACGRCNRCKNDMTLGAFSAWVKRVAARLP